jgi:hypothetical protein
MAAPDFTSFHQSISEELYAVKDRIRNLVKQHWPTDGEHKELALKNVLSKHLPKSAIVGRGFIVTKDECSTQVDVLIVDSKKPTLFHEGDLMIVTPDAVLAVIEVKTSFSSLSKISKALTKLCEIDKLCKQGRNGSVWTGLFVFEYSGQKEYKLRNALKKIGSAHSATGCQINCVAFGHNLFWRFWGNGSVVKSRVNGAVWHAYEIESVAPSYFIGNLIDHISEIDNQNSSFAWFPKLDNQGKESYRKFYLEAGKTEVERF